VAQGAGRHAESAKEEGGSNLKSLAQPDRRSSWNSGEQAGEEKHQQQRKQQRQHITGKSDGMNTVDRYQDG
jgi:hypothetical protein